MSLSVKGHGLRSVGRHDDTPPAVGQMIGKYRIVRDLGTVGMARVFLAALEGPGGFSKTYVIKRISPGQVPNPRFASVLANEASVAAALDHANVVRLLEFFQDDDDSYFLVMEHVDGVSLDHLVKGARRVGTPLGVDVASEIGLALARALAHIHGAQRPDGRLRDLLHGDVSLGNVLVSREGAVKLTNLGVANSAVAIQPAGGVTAKLSYMSPEQLAGTRTDARSDLFSLGVILYEVATGVRLVGGDAPDIGELEAISAGGPSRLPVTETGAQPAFASIVTRLLRRDPAARHQSAADLVAELEALRASRPASARGVSLGEAVRACLATFEMAPPPSPAPVAAYVAAATPDATATPVLRPRGLTAGAAEADEVPVRLVLGLSLFCLVCSLIFWFAVFLRRSS